MHFTRIYCDETGESHFEDVTVDVHPINFAPPAPPLNLSYPLDAERMFFCTLPAGRTGDWHPAPRRQFFFQLSGELEVQVSDGEIRPFSCGNVALLEDIKGKGHVTRVVGTSDVEGVFIQLPVVESSKLEQTKPSPSRI